MILFSFARERKAGAYLDYPDLRPVLQSFVGPLLFSLANSLFSLARNIDADLRSTAV